MKRGDLTAINASAARRAMLASFGEETAWRAATHWSSAPGLAA
jgi:hypothetical protein